MKNIIMLGPDLNVKGGVSSVERILIENMAFNESFKITFIPSHRDYSNSKKFIFAIYSLNRFLFKCLTEKVDVVYLHMSHRASFWRKSMFILVCRLLGKKYIIHMHGSDFDIFYNTKGSLCRKYITFILNGAESIIALTEKWKEFYSTIAKNERITVVYNSVKVSEKNLYNSRNKTVLFMGRLEERKGIRDLMAIIPEVLSANPRINFTLAGDGDIEGVKKEMENKNLQPRVTVPGWVGSSEKEALLKKACIFILPSYSEGLSMSVLEAMSYGVPVIASEVGGISEVIEDGRDGILIKAGDREALKENILWLLDCELMRDSISLKSYEKIKKHFNSDSFVRIVTNIINEAVKA